MSELSQFSKILKSQRIINDWNQTDVSKKTGISSATLSNYEKGLSDPSLKNLCLLADLFGISLDYLGRGLEYKLPLRPEEQEGKQINRMTLRIENRVERQTRLLGHIGRRLETDIVSIVKDVCDDFRDVFSKSASIVLLEEEVWNIELCSPTTMVAYPYVDDNLIYNESTGHYEAGDFFHYQIENLKSNTSYRYIEVYADNVDRNGIKDYKKLVSQYCGSAALDRVEVYQCKEPIISQYVIYEVNLSKLQRNHPTLYHSIEGYIFDDCFIALLVTPQQYPDINILADQEHYHYIRNHFNYLISRSEKL